MAPKQQLFIPRGRKAEPLSNKSNYFHTFAFSSCFLEFFFYSSLTLTRVADKPESSAVGTSALTLVNVEQTSLPANKTSPRVERLLLNALSLRKLALIVTLLRNALKLDSIHLSKSFQNHIWDSKQNKKSSWLECDLSSRLAGERWTGEELKGRTVQCQGRTALTQVDSAASASPKAFYFRLDNGGGVCRWPPQEFQQFNEGCFFLSCKLFFFFCSETQLRLFSPTLLKGKNGSK